MFRSLLFIILLLTPIIVSAQIVDMGGPFSWTKHDLFTQDVPVHITPGFDLKLLRQEDAENDPKKEAPWRFGYKYETNLDFQNGVWKQLDNGDKLWSMEIYCPNALSINLIFSNYFVPEGAHLYLYDKQKTNRVGAYTSRNNRIDGMLGSELVIGDHIVVEYYEPAAVSGQGRFEIQNIIHGYRNVEKIQNELAKDLNDSGDCHYDVECPEGTGWEDQLRSICMIVVNGNGICTGALINNLCEDGRPLILSANHCMSSSPSTWAFRFNWKTQPGTEACASTGLSVDPGPPYDQTANGATVLANGTEADHLLLEVDTMTLTDAINWNLFYSGWNRNDADSIYNATSFHHPNGDVMKLSIEDDVPYHSSAAAASVWWIDEWETGTTAGGSSGGPLYDHNKRIIGQLFGGTAGCIGTASNGNHDYYGRIGVAWDYGLSQHLAPTSCGDAIVIDGWDPSVANELNDASIQTIEAPRGKICDDSFTPEVIIRNAGDNDLTSCILNYSIDGGPILTFNWTGLLQHNEYETIALPNQTASAGGHTFTAYTSLPNGVADEDHDNDSITVSFSLAPNTVATFINILTDCYGYETAWELMDGSNTVLFSGGNQTVPPGGAQTATSSDPNSYGNETQIREKLCLNVGCYDFIIYDDWGDGLEGTLQFGCDTDGEYFITNSSNHVLGAMQNVAFGVSDTVNFCVVNDASIIELNPINVSIYPNPSKGSFTISMEQFQASFELEVRDVTGRLIHSERISQNHQNVQIKNCANGNYFLSLKNDAFRFTQPITVYH